MVKEMKKTITTCMPFGYSIKLHLLRW